MTAQILGQGTNEQDKQHREKPILHKELQATEPSWE